MQLHFEDVNSCVNAEASPDTALQNAPATISRPGVRFCDFGDKEFLLCIKWHVRTELVVIVAWQQHFTTHHGFDHCPCQSHQHCASWEVSDRDTIGADRGTSGPCSCHSCHIWILFPRSPPAQSWKCFRQTSGSICRGSTPLLCSGESECDFLHNYNLT